MDSLSDLCKQKLAIGISSLPPLIQDDLLEISRENIKRDCLAQARKEVLQELSFLAPLITILGREKRRYGECDVYEKFQNVHPSLITAALTALAAAQNYINDPQDWLSDEGSSSDNDY